MVGIYTEHMLPSASAVAVLEPGSGASYAVDQPAGIAINSLVMPATPEMADRLVLHIPAEWRGAFNALGIREFVESSAITWAALRHGEPMAVGGVRAIPYSCAGLAWQMPTMDLFKHRTFVFRYTRTVLGIAATQFPIIHALAVEQVERLVIPWLVWAGFRQVHEPISFITPNFRGRASRYEWRAADQMARGG